MNNLRKSMVYIAVLISAIFFSRCTLTEDIASIKKSVDSLQIIVGTPQFNTNVHFEFIDANTKQLIRNSDVSVVVSGKDAGVIYNNIGQKKSSYTSKMGFVDLVADPHKVDSITIKTTPLEFVVTTNVSGYTSASQKVIINKTSRHTVVIPLIKLDAAPVGVTVAVNNSFAVTGTDGKIQNTTTQNMNAGKQTIVIPKNVILKDASGAPITGTLKSEIVFFDPTSEAAQDAIPGSLAVEAKLADGTTENIQFVSAGMFNIKLTAGDKAVKSFENGGITIKTVVPSTMINPNTGVLVKENDVIEMWSIEEGSGKWIFEKVDTVRKVNGELVLEETVKHLSSWNWDFHYKSCYLGPKFVWKGSLTSTNLYAKVSSKFNSYNYKTNFKVNPSISYYNELQINNTPRDVPAIFKFENSDYNSNSGKELVFSPASVSISNMCDGKTYEIQVSEKSLSNETVKVNVELSATSASNSNFRLMPNTWIYYWKTDTYNYNYAQMTNGKTSFALLLDREYQIGASFGYNWGQGTLKVQNEGTSSYRLTFTPQIDYSSTKTIAPITYVVPKDATNTVNVKYAGVLSDDVFNSLK